MNSIDALGSRPDRRQAFSRDLLAEADDETLQAIVRQAADELETPIALVTLVLDQIQFFKAHYGLPEELEASRGTARDVSFCQFVVRDGEPFEVTDAPNDPRVPQHLVQEYGIRAYLGMPLRVDDIVVGSLCVIDTRERTFSAEEQEALAKMAALVNERVSALAAKRREVRLGLADEAAPAAISELRDTLSPFQREIEACIQANTAIRSFLKLASFAEGGGKPSKKAYRRSLDAALQAAAKSEDRLYDMEASAADAEDSAAALEVLTSPSHSARLSEVLEASQDLVRGVSRKIGGVQLPDLSSDPVLTTPRPLAVGLVTAGLNGLVDQLRNLQSKCGIEMNSSEEDEKLILRLLCRDLPRNAFADIAANLQERIADDPSIAIDSGETFLDFAFSTASH